MKIGYVIQKHKFGRSDMQTQEQGLRAPTFILKEENKLKDNAPRPDHSLACP
jgi:hypothetical protein